MQRPGGEIRKLLLEGAEGHGAFIEVVVRLRGLQAEAAHKLIAAPIAAALVLVVVFTVGRGDKLQNLCRVVNLGADVLGHGDDVFHQLHGLFKHVGVDALENILFVLIGDDVEGIVDMSMSEILAAKRAALDLEMVNGLFHRFLQRIDVGLQIIITDLHVQHKP